MIQDCIHLDTLTWLSLKSLKNSTFFYLMIFIKVFIINSTLTCIFMLTRPSSKHSPCPSFIQISKFPKYPQHYQECFYPIFVKFCCNVYCLAGAKSRLLKSFPSLLFIGYAGKQLMLFQDWGRDTGRRCGCVVWSEDIWGAEQPESRSAI